MMGRTDGHANGRMKSRRSIIKYCPPKKGYGMINLCF